MLARSERSPAPASKRPLRFSRFACCARCDTAYAVHAVHAVHAVQAMVMFTVWLQVRILFCLWAGTGALQASSELVQMHES